MREWNCWRKKGKGAAWFQISLDSFDTSSSHVYTHTHTHTHIYRKHTGMQIYTHTYIYIYKYAYIYTYLKICMYIYVYVCVSYICLYIFHSGEVTPWFTLVIHEVVVWK